MNAADTAPGPRGRQGGGRQGGSSCSPASREPAAGRCGGSCSGQAEAAPKPPVPVDPCDIGMLGGRVAVRYLGWRRSVGAWITTHWLIERAAAQSVRVVVAQSICSC